MKNQALRKPQQTEQERAAAIAKHITPREIEMIKLWEDIDARDSVGWGNGGLPKKRRVGGADILKAEAIIKAQARMLEAQKKEQNWIQPELPLEKPEKIK